MHRIVLGFWILGFAAAAPAAVLEVAELNTGQIAALDRSRTVVILVGGILEQHGPYLPAYTDGYISAQLAGSVAEAVGGREGWTALVFPQIPLGSSGANEIGGHYVFPGTYVLRNDTLRSVYMDLADQLGEAGFRWILVVHLHGAPLQNRMLDQASDYFRATHGGRMLHLYGLMRVLKGWGERSARIEPELAEAEAFCVHSCADETGAVMHLRPGLVGPGVADAPPLVGGNIAELRAIAKHGDWPGYFGTPGSARAEFGKAALEAIAREMIAAANDLLDGHDERLGLRFSDVVDADPQVREIGAAALEWEERIAARQRQWLDRRR